MKRLLNRTVNSLYFSLSPQGKDISRIGASCAIFRPVSQSHQYKPSLLYIPVPQCSCSRRSYRSVYSGYVPNSPFGAVRHYVATSQSGKASSDSPDKSAATSESPPPPPASSESPLASSDSPEPEKKLTLYQKFKSMYRDYWYVLVPVHLVTSAAWFGGFYYMATSGVDIVSILESFNVSDKLINPFRNGHTGYLAISYALYKIATPVRYTVTLGGTTISINYLKKWGYIKPVPSKEKLKEMYEDKKQIYKEKGLTLKDNMMQSLKPSSASKKKNP